MNILLRDGDWWLGQALTNELESDGHGVANVPYSEEIGHEETSTALVGGIDGLVVFGHTGRASDATEAIDHSTRQLYNLLHAASESGVKRCVYVSSLELFRDYEENLTVTENWRSLPPTDDSALLACHLGEVVCKEFARDRRIEVVNIRLGFPIVEGGTLDTEASGASAAISAEDALGAIVNALSEDLNRQWQVIHVQSKVTNQRFLMQEGTQ